MNRSYAQPPMNRPLPDFCAFKVQLLLLPLHKAPVRSPAPKAFITGFIRLKLHSPLSMVQAKGVEPLILSAAASKTAMYTNSNTPGYMRPLIFTRNGTLKPRIINDIPTGCIKLFLALALRENYDISTLGLTAQCSASELPKHIMVIPAGIEPTFQA